MNGTPMIILDPHAVLVDVTWTNEKAAAKSVERGELWFLHHGTQRVLPWKGGGATFESLAERSSVEGGRWYEVRLRDTVAEDASSDAKTADGDVARSEDPSLGSDVDLTDAGTILAALEGTIRRRKRDMPDGSYTTHLFEKGPDKIRKKAGEEAIELLLARSTDELLSESADFLYHLMVLLEVEGASIASVLGKLQDRA